MKKFIVFMILFLCLCMKNILTFADLSSPLVSVIIPVYNTCEYLSECLNSVANQTLKDIEIILVDDGSTDGSLELLEKYRIEDPRVTLITQQNKGASSARNRGLDIAKGKYIAFVDSDDTIDTDAYEISYSKAKEVNADILIFAEKKLSVKEGIFYNPLEILKSASYIPIWNKLYKREFLNEFGAKFYENAKCFNDDCFNTIVIPNAKVIKCISNKFYTYRRRREGSIQTSRDSKKKAEGALIYENYVKNNLQKNNYNINYRLWLDQKINRLKNRYR